MHSHRGADYLNQVVRQPGGGQQTARRPASDDLIIFDLEKTGNYAAVRPSGTEPKVKFYNFAYEPAEQLANLDDAKQELEKRLTNIESDLHAAAEAV